MFEHLDDDAQAQAEIRKRVTEAALALKMARTPADRSYLDASKILAMDWRDRPKDPQKADRPLYRATSDELRNAYRDEFKQTTDLYRAAMVRWRKFKPDPDFPEWTFPPGHLRCVGAKEVPEPIAPIKAQA